MPHPAILQAAEDLGITSIIEVLNQMYCCPHTWQPTFSETDISSLPKDRMFAVAGRVNHQWEIFLPFVQWSENRQEFVGTIQRRWNRPYLLLFSPSPPDKHPFSVNQ